MREVYVITLGNNPATGISLYASSAFCYCPPSQNTLMREFYVMTLGVSPAAFIRTNASSTFCHFPPLPYALMRELVVHDDAGRHPSRPHLLGAPHSYNASKPVDDVTVYSSHYTFKLHAFAINAEKGSQQDYRKCCPRYANWWSMRWRIRAACAQVARVDIRCMHACAMPCEMRLRSTSRAQSFTLMHAQVWRADG
jgi:hypothetical protein